ncbi:MAG: PrsW family intramembrane metalloprotease [Bacteroidales bacterium]|nr:PrsW family intramembrane metalloprotease [Bacteroidales bacterium]
MIVNYIVTLVPAPLIAILLILFVQKRTGRGYYTAITSSFIWGMISIGLVVFFQYIAAYYRLDDRNIRRIIFYSFVVMGIGSELGKYLIVRYFCFTKRNFDGPLDAIYYSAIVSLGFVFMGNILYLILPVYPEIDITYSISVVFANLAFAVILGFFVGLAKLRENRFIDSMSALFAASFFHALFNFCFITKDYKLLIYSSIGILIVALLLIYKAVQMNQMVKIEKKKDA